tara:strand:+ start:1553 stop:1957 length:405 start_codon:yes stop_codon:yes gene_type:complete
MGQSVNLDVSEKLKITTRRGDNFSLTLTLKDNTGTVIDISSGYTFSMVVRAKSLVNGNIEYSYPLGNSSVVVADNQVTISAPTSAGVVTFSAEDTVTKLIPEGSYEYEIAYDTAANGYKTILKGPFVVNASLLY